MIAFASVIDAPPGRPPVRRTNGRVPPPPRRTGGDGGDDREPEPRRPVLDNARLATMFLIAAEVMLFAGLISAFFVLRMSAVVWPPPLQPRLPVAVTGVNTLVLLASSVAVAAAVRALRQGALAAVAPRLGAAAALGTTFLAVQGYEWVRLVGFGLTVTSGAYGGTFYTLIGAHALHVLGALAWLALTFRLVRTGKIAPDRSSTLRACAMYWHFVVALWPVLYVVVYLL
ncbi:MAG: heme-copper oxidase subunit III [Candidatus Rokubacteria bacterium]|nr:heme-copper oxidase subunit III [Candidatus Rokubacteria bacterium]